MPETAKLPRKKLQNPKALSAIARQQLLLIDGLVDEVARNYVARLRRELGAMVRKLEKPPVHARRPGRVLEDLQGMLRLITRLRIAPEKGRRKDLKRIDTLIGEIQSLLDKW
jgi:hypothetical protein